MTKTPHEPEHADSKGYACPCSRPEGPHPCDGDPYYSDDDDDEEGEGA